MLHQECWDLMLLLEHQWMIFNQWLVSLCCSDLTVCSVTAPRPSPRRRRTPSPSTHPLTCGRSSSPRTRRTLLWCPPVTLPLLHQGTTWTTTLLQSEWHTHSESWCVLCTSFNVRLCFRFSFEREGSPAEVCGRGEDPEPGVCLSVNTHFGQVKSLRTSCSC